MAHNKIHVNSSTGLSLNDRFTAMAERTTEVRRQRSRSRSRSLVRELQPVNPATSQANRRLLLQLERRHKMLAAMRVKRKSLRPAGAGYLKRGSIKAMRVAANGRPIKANSLTKVATMKADLIGPGPSRRAGGGRPLRRFDSASNISQRLGVNRAVGGAAERIERRRLARLRAEIVRNAASFNAGRNGNGGIGARNIGNRRGRSRSRTRLSANSNKVGISAALSRGRSRSRSRNRLQNNGGGRSQSRNRLGNNNNNISSNSRNVANLRRGRSMSRNRDNYENLPVKARLGVRPNANGRSNSSGNANLRQRRNSSTNRRNQKVIRGRVDKRRATNVQRLNNGNGGRMAPARGRSRSRTRKGQQQGQQQDRQRLQGRVGSNNRQAVVNRRGRSRQRGNNSNNNNNNINNKNNNRRGNGRKNAQQQQQQPRRGRSRSRRGGRNLGGQSSKPQNVNKEDLDKELDQYMATTRNENDLDFLLKN